MALATAAGCGEKSVVVADPDVSPLVGDWSAKALVLKSVFNPDLAPDLVQLGASFTLNVQASGQYTAILLYSGQAATEIGMLTVSGNVVTMQVSFPNPSTWTMTYALQGGNLILDGDTEFDFNLDGTKEPAVAHFELRPK